MVAQWVISALVMVNTLKLNALTLIQTNPYRAVYKFLSKVNFTKLNKTFVMFNMNNGEHYTS